MYYRHPETKTLQSASITVLDLSSLTEDTRLFIIGTIFIITDSSLAIPCLAMNAPTALKHSVYYSSNFADACMHAKSLQSCPTLCNSMDCSPPGSSVHGILHARKLEWVSMPSSRGSSQPRDWSHSLHLKYTRAKDPFYLSTFNNILSQTGGTRIVSCLSSKM